MKKLIIKRGISSKNLPINAFIPLTPFEKKALTIFEKNFIYQKNFQSIVKTSR